jgi:hypothetical protein
MERKRNAGLHAVYRADFVSAVSVLSGSAGFAAGSAFWAVKTKNPVSLPPKMGRKRNTGLHAVYRADFISANPTVLAALPPTRSFMPRKRVSNQCVLLISASSFFVKREKQNLLLFFRKQTHMGVSILTSF